jgi:hypothetical protein
MNYAPSLLHPERMCCILDQNSAIHSVSLILGCSVGGVYLMENEVLRRGRGGEWAQSSSVRTTINSNPHLLSDDFHRYPYLPIYWPSTSRFRGTAAKLIPVDAVASTLYFAKRSSVQVITRALDYWTMDSSTLLHYSLRNLLNPTNYHTLSVSHLGPRRSCSVRLHLSLTLIRLNGGKYFFYANRPNAMNLTTFSAILTTLIVQEWRAVRFC